MKFGNIWIWILSLGIPGLVILLMNGPKLTADTDITFLPRIYASINFITVLLLLLAFKAIKQKKINLHQKLMKTALALSVIFLLLYVIYHSGAESTKYGGEGVIAYIYYFILISHILLSIIIIPLVLITLRKALRANYDSHRKWAKWTWPIWVYVASTGVIVYVMISPYY